jgi:hypothetical protein
MDVLLAILFWLLTGAAAWSMAAGNPTAINGVIGAAAGAVVFTGLAIWDRA